MQNFAWNIYQKCKFYQLNQTVWILWKPLYTEHYGPQDRALWHTAYKQDWQQIVLEWVRGTKKKSSNPIKIYSNFIMSIISALPVSIIWSVVLTASQPGGRRGKRLRSSQRFLKRFTTTCLATWRPCSVRQTKTLQERRRRTGTKRRNRRKKRRKKSRPRCHLSSQLMPAQRKTHRLDLNSPSLEMTQNQRVKRQVGYLVYLSQTVAVEIQYVLTILTFIFPSFFRRVQDREHRDAKGVMATRPTFPRQQLRGGRGRAGGRQGAKQHHG